MDSIGLLTDQFGNLPSKEELVGLRKKGELSDDDLLNMSESELGQKSDNIGQTASLLSRRRQAETARNTRPPNRADIITQVLNEQLDVLKRRRGGLGMTAPMEEPAQEQVASTALFGV